MSRLSCFKRLLGITALGVGLLAAPASATAATSPAPPSSLTVLSDPTGVVVSWADNSSDETGFSIERCLGTGCTDFAQIATVGAGVRSHVDGFYAISNNRYRVRAYNSSGSSAYSNVGEIAMLSTNDVSAQIQAAPASGPTPLIVSFDGSASAALNGTITAWTWSFGDNQTASGARVSHTYSVPGVYAASLKVTTTGTFGGSASNSTSVNIAVMEPAVTLVAPSNLAATSTRGKVRLTWTNPVSSTTSLVLQRCTGSNCTSFTQVAPLSTGETAYTDTNVRRGSTYTYRLAASDGAATAYSNSAVVIVRK